MIHLFVQAIYPLILVAAEIKGVTVTQDLLVDDIDAVAQ